MALVGGLLVVPGVILIADNSFRGDAIEDETLT